MRHTLPGRLAIAAAAALTLSAAGPALDARTFGPPWISIETPPNPFDRATRGAFLVVHTFHHGDVVASGVTGTAEGIVGGERRSIRLAFDTTSRPGSYALRKQWPADGVWMLVISTGAGENGVTALVDVSASGEVARVRVPTRRADGWDIPVQVTARDIDSALRSRASNATAMR